MDPVPQDSSREVRLQPVQLPPKLLRSLISSGLSYCSITWVNWRRETQKGLSILKPCQCMVWHELPGLLWEETTAAIVPAIRFLLGRNSKWAGHLCQGPNTGYTRSLAVLACLSHESCLLQVTALLACPRFVSVDVKVQRCVLLVRNRGSFLL